MSTQLLQLEAAISALETQRATLGDAVVDAALTPLRAELARISSHRTEPARATSHRAEQTLKQATVLFLDVVGSTALAQRLDAEDIHAILDGLLARCTAIVQSHQGKVLQYAGDNLLAVFGAEQSREDDAERAVHAGLALLAAGRAQGGEVMRRHGHAGFDVRVGVHTGRVLLGGGVDAEHSIRGNTVHIAARLEQSAPAGGVRISHDTYRHVRGVFDVEAQPPIVVKGVDETLRSYLVQRAKPRAFRVATRGIEGVETRMVGRDAELELLQDAFKRVCAEPRFQAITVVGEAGLGKSRLLYEFENWAEARPEAFCVFQARAQPQTQSQPYGLLRELFAWRLQIADSDSMELARQKFEQGVAPLFELDDGPDLAQAHAHLLGHLIGLDFLHSRHVKDIRDDARQVRSRAFHAGVQVLRRMAARQGMPIVMMLDDLQWADDGSLEFLTTLAQANHDVPTLVVGLARPSLFERRNPLAFGADSHRRVDLAPLGRGDSNALAGELLHRLPHVPDALRALLDRAEGNPFYMEELVKMLVDAGAIRTGDVEWHLEPERLLGLEVPQSLTGVLQARLDALAPEERLALQRASVIGVVFWDQALAALDAAALAALPSLLRRELITARPGTSLDGKREFAFQHQLLHQVTYDTLLKLERRESHAKAAAWLAAQDEPHKLQFLGATAEHFAKAGDLASAVEYFARAAGHAAGRFAYDVAMHEVWRALALMDAREGTQQDAKQAELHWRLLDVRERMFDLKGQRREQLADLDALQGLADCLGDDRRRGVVQWRRSDLAFRTADPQTQQTTARLAMAFAERAGDETLRLIAQDRLALAMVNLGQAAEGKRLVLDGLTHARANGLRKVEARCHNVLSLIAEREGDVTAMLEADRYELPIVRELGDRRSEAVCLNNLGLSLLNVGERVEARGYLEQGWHLTRALGDRTQEPYARVNLAQLELWEGDAEVALTHALAALDGALSVQDLLQAATALGWLGAAELALGQHAKASEAFARSFDMARGIDHAQQHDATAGLARVALAQGDIARASALVQGMLAHLDAGGTWEGTEAPRLIQWSCWQVLHRAGDPRARDLLASAHADVQLRAASITDPRLRRSFLDQIPENRAILAALGVPQATA